MVTSELDNRPPPIITYGPQNQTLPLSTVAMMPCAAIGDPPPTVRWLMHGRPVPTTTDPRLAQLDSGTLQISGWQLSFATFRTTLSWIRDRV